jgi:hypothetical protein
MSQNLSSQHVWKIKGPALYCTKYQRKEEIQEPRPQKIIDAKFPGYTGFKKAEELVFKDERDI